MGSSLHLPGVGLRSSLIGQRNSFRAIQERDRQQTADVRWAQVVRSKGAGLHILKDFCNDAQYPVGSALGSMSFKPGTIVAVMSHSGTPNEVIVALSGPGRAGASAFPVALSTRSTRFAVEGPPPAPISGHSYLGLYLEEHPSVSGIWRIRAWRYADGRFIQEVQVSQYQIPLSVLSDARAWQRIHSSGDVVVCTTPDVSFGTSLYIYWNTAETLIRGAGSFEWTFGLGMGDAVWPGAGADLYFHASNANSIQLHRVPLSRLIGGNNFDPGETQIGSNQLTDAPLFPAPNPLCATGQDFQVPALDSVTAAVACPYTNGTTWGDGRARVLVNAVDPAALSCGWPVTGNRSARLTAFESGEQTVGLLGVGPASPELALLPATWGLADVAGISVAPGGAQLALYPATLTGDEAGEGDNKLLRLAALSTAYPEEPSVGRLTIEPGPNGELPHVMLCRD